MDLRQLETFIEVIKLKSFSKAADKLYITQPTVTNHIQNLENELGTLLINRMGRNITPTEAGNLLFKYAVNIINSCEMAKFDLAMYKGKIQGNLDIMFSSIPRNYLLPSIIKSFIKIYPEVTFTITENDSKEVINKIIDGDVDFGVVGAIYPSTSLNFVDIMSDNLVLIAPVSFKTNLPNFSYIDVNDILHYKIILREEGSGTRSLIMNKLQEKGIDTNSLNILACVEDTETIKELVSLGLGISFISEKAVSDDINLNKYKVLYLSNIDFSRSFYFVYHKNRQLSPLGEAFKEHIILNTKGQNA